MIETIIGVVCFVVGYYVAPVFGGKIVLKYITERNKVAIERNESMKAHNQALKDINELQDDYIALATKHKDLLTQNQRIKPDVEEVVDIILHFSTSVILDNGDEDLVIDASNFENLAEELITFFDEYGKE
jgi:hypothetical protein